MKKYLHLFHIGLLTLFFVISVHSNWIQNRIIDELTVSRLKDSLSSLVEQNESSVYDWASWDETVDLVSQKNKNYFDENFNQDTARVLQLAIATDKNNVAIAGKRWNEEIQEFESLNTQDFANLSPNLQECGSSFTTFWEGNYLISSSFISPTIEGKGNQIYGCLYFGQLLPNAKLATIFANLENKSELGIDKILMTQNTEESPKKSYSTRLIVIKGRTIGLFGTNVLIIKSRFTSIDQLLATVLYLILLISLMKKQTNQSASQ